MDRILIPFGEFKGFDIQDVPLDKLEVLMSVLERHSLTEAHPDLYEGIVKRLREGGWLKDEA